MKEVSETESSATAGSNAKAATPEGDAGKAGKAKAGVTASGIDISKIPGVTEIPSFESVSEERDRLQNKEVRSKTLRSTIFIIVVIAAAAVLAITLLFPVLRVSGTSMEPTLEDGDVVVMMKQGGFDTSDLVGFYFQNKLLIKRVIAGPGDWIDIDDDGNVTVNGVKLDEPYIAEKALGETDVDLPLQVPENRYFVMGDHRATSVDSRSTVIGTIEADQIAGKIILRVWPLGEFSLLN